MSASKRKNFENPIAGYTTMTFHPTWSSDYQMGCISSQHFLSNREIVLLLINDESLAVCYSPQESFVKLWNLKTDKFREFHKSNTVKRAVAVSENQFAVIHSDKINFWDCESLEKCEKTAEVKLQYSFQRFSVTKACMSSDSKHLLFTVEGEKKESDKTVTVINVVEMASMQLFSIEIPEDKLLHDFGILSPTQLALYMQPFTDKPSSTKFTWLCDFDITKKTSRIHDKPVFSQIQGTNHMYTWPGLCVTFKLHDDDLRCANLWKIKGNGAAFQRKIGDIRWEDYCDFQTTPVSCVFRDFHTGHIEFDFKSMRQQRLNNAMALYNEDKPSLLCQLPGYRPAVRCASIQYSVGNNYEKDNPIYIFNLTSVEKYFAQKRFAIVRDFFQEKMPLGIVRLIVQYGSLWQGALEEKQDQLQPTRQKLTSASMS